MIWWNGNMVGWLEYVNMVLWKSGAMIFFFPNGEMVNLKFCTYGEMVKSLYGVMVIWSNGESIVLGHISIGGEVVKCWNGKIVKKTNSKMDCVVRFNHSLGYQLGFILLYFRPACHWYSSWWLWGSSPVLSLVYSGLPNIMSFCLSIFYDGEVM